MTDVSGCTPQRSSSGIRTTTDTFTGTEVRGNTTLHHSDVMRGMVVGSITSREHYQGALQHLVGFLSLFVAFFTIFLILLAESEVAK